MAAKQEALNELRARMRPILARLVREYPEAKCSLDFKNPFELIAATILSAQCTDVRVNLVTPALFKKYPDAVHMARAKPAELEKLIQSTGFFRTKAQALVAMSQALVKNYGGEVPADLEALVELRGVGRKTANVVLGNAFGIPGLVVDTHVGRLCRRMGFTREKDPVKVEHAMEEIVPREMWTVFSHYLIAHGRAVCTARNALCEGCVLAGLCPKIGVGAD